MAIFTGTSAANQIVGTATADTIRGYGGNDILEGLGGGDKIYGGGGNDTITGGKGNDTLSGGAGSDIFLFAAGDGQDTITDLGAGDVVKVSGYSAAESVTQAGTNVVVTLSAGDKMTFSAATVAEVQAALQFGSGSSGGSNGGTGANITGTAGSDTLSGTSGNDTIYGLGGYDVINGGAGNDRICGGLYGDSLTGGAGADVFVYLSLAEAPPYGLMYYESDRILDFQSIDKIDLSAVDANSSLAGKQSFHFAGVSDGSPADHSPGSLYVGVNGGYVWIFGYTDDSGHPTLYIDLTGGAVPTAANLIL